MFEQLKTKTMNPDDRAMMEDLVEEHVTARRVVAELIHSEAGFVNGDQSQISVIREKLTFLMSFYPVHIAKEDKLFFPNTERYFQDAELDNMMDDFQVFDRNMIHEKYNKLYKLLKDQMADDYS